MSTMLITGANRGIGLELCRILSARGDEIIATCREGSSELEGLGVRIHTGLDVSDDASVADLARAMDGVRLDVLVNNAGILTVETLEDLDWNRIRRQFEVNTLGPLRVTRALLPSLRAGSTVVMMTSLMGSMADSTSGSYYGYRMSKAALNMAAMSLARDLESRKISVAILHPGMVATEMTGGRGIPPSESAQGLVKRLDEWNLGRSGELRRASGETLPW